jgi:AcrR family transcriptional regulator
MSGWDRRRITLLCAYERVALELFAARGFKDVTVDDVADAAGVSARTLFRYFPTKEDLLVGFPRRTTDALVDRIVAQEPSDYPLETVWRLMRSLLLDSPPDVALLNLWRQAASEAPEVVDRVRGERTQALLEAVARYCHRSLAPAESNDVRSRLLAGIVVGVELAMVEALGRSQSTLGEIIEVAEHSIGLLDRATQAGIA